MAIDEQHVAAALRWLRKQQQETGCFLSVGKLLNNALQVGQWVGGTRRRVAKAGLAPARRWCLV